MNLIRQTLVIASLVLLALAGLLLALGHNPESWWHNFQAETLGNYAYGLAVIAFILSLIGRIKKYKK